MIKKLKRKLGRQVLCIPGKSIKRKIIVIESDDWGSIRMPSRVAYERLLSKGIKVGLNPFNKYDSLESEEDLNALFELLLQFKDHRGNYPLITANFIMANPDFDKIAASGFQSFVFERLTETYKRYPACKKSYYLLKQGIDKGLIYPQFHGREHLNVLKWLQLLQVNHRELIASFEEHFFGLEFKNNVSNRSNLMATFDYENKQELSFILDSIKDGYKIFEETFDFRSQSFIAPCYVWDDAVEATLATLGTQFIQGTFFQYQPQGTGKPYKRRLNFLGRRNKFGQLYLIRNCYFELSTNPNYDWLSNCMEKIEAAFYWNKPAIISMHRLNFIGSIFSSNRDNNLKRLESLLEEILRRWPEVEFMHSADLGRLLLKN